MLTSTNLHTGLPLSQLDERPRNLYATKRAPVTTYGGRTFPTGLVPGQCHVDETFGPLLLAPSWGNAIGHVSFFLHDGRTWDLKRASRTKLVPGSPLGYYGGEGIFQSAKEGRAAVSAEFPAIALVWSSTGCSWTAESADWYLRFYAAVGRCHL